MTRLVLLMTSFVWRRAHDELASRDQHELNLCCWICDAMRRGYHAGASVQKRDPNQPYPLHQPHLP